MTRIRILATIVTAGLSLLAGLPAAAQAVFTPPPGCKGTLTVQLRSCQVSNFYSCTSDPAGYKWRADFIDGGEPTYLGLIDGQAQWIESYDFFPTSREITLLPPADPMSFDELTKTGSDSFDFQQRRDDGPLTQVTGQDRLTGKTVVIDGQPLLQTEFVAREYRADGTLIYEAKGNEFIHLELRRFFAGRSTVTIGDTGQEFQRNRTPVDFIFEGEPGYMSPNPDYDCNTIVSRLSPLPITPAEKG